MPDTTDILLVQPPVQHPACYPSAVLKAAAGLRASGREIACFHAGLDFYVNYLMTESVQARLSAQVQERLQRRDYQDAADEIRQRAQAIAEGQIPAGETPGKPWIMGEGAMSLSCGDPCETVRELQRLDTALRLASTAWYPAHFDRRGFRHPAIDGEPALYSYLDDPQCNPFLEYARQCGLPAISSGQCAAVALIVSAPGQMAGALTLARCWKQRWPALAVSVCATREPWRTVAVQLFEQMREPAAARIAAIVDPVIDETGANSGNSLGSSAAAVDEMLAFRLEPAQMPSLPASLAQGDGRVVVWQHAQGPMSEISRLLYQVAKLGHWNHLVLSAQDDPSLAARLSQFAKENPYIVHSWCRREKPLSRYSDGLERFPTGTPPYGATRPLPGRPIWMRLQDPVCLQECVRSHGAKRLAQQRIDDDGQALPILGSGLVYHYLPPGQLPDGYLDDICLMVEAGGTVGSRWLRHNLERAFLIGYAEENGLIAGNSSLKRPREEYVAAVSAQCGIDLRDYLERGYTSVRPEYRSLGIGAKLLEGLTERAGSYKVYSVIAEDNVATQKMAIRNRTRKVASFFSERTQKQIGIWVPEWMLPEDTPLPPQPDLT